jgi:hypothetical protein
LQRLQGSGKKFVQAAGAARPTVRRRIDGENALASVDPESTAGGRQAVVDREGNVVGRCQGLRAGGSPGFDSIPSTKRSPWIKSIAGHGLVAEMCARHCERRLAACGEGK